MCKFIQYLSISFIVIVFSANNSVASSSSNIDTFLEESAELLNEICFSNINDSALEQIKDHEIFTQRFCNGVRSSTQKCKIVNSKIVFLENSIGFCSYN